MYLKAGADAEKDREEIVDTDRFENAFDRPRRLDILRDREVGRKLWRQLRAKFDFLVELATITAHTTQFTT